MPQRRTAASPPARGGTADAPDTRENQLLAIVRRLGVADVMRQFLDIGLNGLLAAPAPANRAATRVIAGRRAAIPAQP